MGRSPTQEANGNLTGQEIPRFLCNPKVHYLGNRSPPMVRILSQLRPLHTFQPYFP